MASENFNLVRYDICGPSLTLTYHEKRFLLALIKDHSQFTWVYLLGHKSEALSIIKWFLYLVEAQFHKPSKFLELKMPRSCN